MPVTAPPDQLRRDARDNRAAILDAARELFADSADVAMCQVARRAGVGQGTLYRHFPNRSALAAELLDSYIVGFEELAAAEAGAPDAFFVLLRSLFDGVVDLYGLAVLARHDVETDTHLKRNRERIRELLAGPLRDAKKAGILRRDVSLDDVFLIFAMGRGAMDGLPDRAARAAVADRVIELILDGIEQPAAVA
ncbi:MAG TPA: helix-turn-helix domain-containing protein [Solirubrobacterales bacterium]|nr:helix-turn-helix domain-containing protein [Solirubrobacterales bacterium]